MRSACSHNVSLTCTPACPRTYTPPPQPTPPCPAPLSVHAAILQRRARLGRVVLLPAQFIDAMEGASGPTGPGSMMPPEDTALTLAISAAQLCNAPRLRARALLLAGQCLQVGRRAVLHRALARAPALSGGEMSIMRVAYQAAGAWGLFFLSARGTVPRLVKLTTTVAAARHTHPMRLPCAHPLIYPPPCSTSS